MAIYKVTNPLSQLYWTFNEISEPQYKQDIELMMMYKTIQQQLTLNNWRCKACLVVILLLGSTVRVHLSKVE